MNATQFSQSLPIPILPYKRLVTPAPYTLSRQKSSGALRTLCAAITVCHSRHVGLSTTAEDPTTLLSIY